MNRIKWIVGLALAMLLRFGTAKAQMVTIPDPNFLIFLQNSSVAGCLTGNQLEASCPAVLNKHKINCSNFNISDLTGLQAFVNLDTLQCYTNQLISLPTLPASLTYLDCSGNNLASLPSLPASLTELFCGVNQLTVLPSLPASLGQLGCDGNQLNALPALPASLTTLYCNSNLLTVLPSLPVSLTMLDCDYNQLTTLPSLSATLTYIDCDFNQLTTLPSLPALLTTLWCSNNQLIALPSLPASLTTLKCNYNQLTALPTLPASLTELDCSANQLTALPSLPASLMNLACGQNQLTVLPSLPASLKFLNCSADSLTTLPSLPASLILLYCLYNQLSALPSLPPLLTWLWCSNNQLTALPALPSAMDMLIISNNPGLMCMPPLQEFTGSSNDFSISNTGITCLPNIIEHIGYIAAIDTMTVCGIFNPNGCEVAWNIKGTTYRDDNSNCLSDSAEPHLPNIKLQLLQGGNVQQQVYSNGVGDYSFNTNLSTYQTRVDTAGLPFNVSCPSNNSHTSTLITTDSLDYAANFALHCKPGYDLAVHSICHSSGYLFPAHTNSISIAVGDLALAYGVSCNTAGLSGTVTATVNGPVSVTGASGNGVVSGNTVTWNVSDFSQLTFFNDFSIQVLVDNIPATNSMCVSATVTGSSGFDNHPSNNSLTQCFQVVNSFDPNYKEVYPTQIDSAGQWLTYTVHFQNTGTAPAQNILVIDTLDSNLDWNSFQLLAYSHDNLTQILNNGIVHFNFPNIELPDSTTNEPLSHGWIQYRIKTNSNVTTSTAIHNTASIYFDFNSPVLTNDAAVNLCTPSAHWQLFHICSGDSVQVGNGWLHQAGTFTNILNNAQGCDSMINTILDVLLPTAFSQSFNICSGDSMLINNQWQHQSGSFINHLNNAVGCDSVVTTTLNVSLPTAFSQSPTLCPGGSVTVGTHTYTQAGTYTDHLSNAASCDSVVTTVLTFDNVDTAVTDQSNVLTAAAGMMSYQWINCANQQPIAGATSQSYAPTQNGTYQVQLTTPNNCTFASACVTVSGLGIANLSATAFNLYPNPTQNSFTVESTVYGNNVLMQLTDPIGRLVLTMPMSNARTVVGLSGVGDGAYLVRVVRNGRSMQVGHLTVVR